MTLKELKAKSVIVQKEIDSFKVEIINKENELTYLKNEIEKLINNDTFSFLNDFRELVIEKGGSTNCYLTRGNGIISFNNFETNFKIEPTISVSEIRQLMAKYNIKKIQLKSSLNSEWGCYYPFIININNKNYNLMEKY